MRARPDRGQATVETALVLPAVAVVLGLLLQVGVLVRDQVLVTHAAREAGRVLALGEDIGAVELAAQSTLGRDPGRIEVVIDHPGATSGDRATVEVRYRAPIAIPLLATPSADVTLRAAITVRIE